MFSGCPSGCPAVRVVMYFLYYANMVQQIELIIYTNIQPLWQKFFTKGQGRRSKVKVKDAKKCFVHAITYLNYCIFPIFYVKLLMSMEMT